jgi:hypothetical protein
LKRAGTFGNALFYSFNAQVLLQRGHGIAREARIQQSAVNSNDRYALARRDGRVAASRSTATRSAR